MGDAANPSPNPSQKKLLNSGRFQFVGRKPENEQLRSTLEDALAGKGQLVMVAGDPGIGKTTLASSLAHEAAGRGVAVLWGRCWEGGGAPVFWPWIQVLRASLQDYSPEMLANSIGSNSSYLVRLLPELGPVQNEGRPTSANPALLTTNEEEEDRFHLFDSVTRLLQKAARDRPLLIIFDDCHCADEASLLLLRFLVRNIAQSPIMVLITYRETDVSLNPRLAEMMSNLGREGRLITLAGLSESESLEFILSAELPPDSAMNSALYQLTEGNPFFLSEILRLLTTEGRKHPFMGDFKLPKSLRAAIRRRFDLVSQSTKNTLTIAAVVGRQFDLAVLQRINGPAFEELYDSMDDAAAAALIIEDTEIPNRFRFRHALIAETLYDDLPKTRRHQLHQQIALILEQIYSDDLESHLPELAHHYVESLDIGGSNSHVDKAIDYAQRAAHRAGESLAYEEAVRLYRMALKALDLQPRPNRHRRCELMLGLAASSYAAGFFDHSRHAFEQAAQIARRLGSVEQLARAVLGVSVFPSDPGTVDQIKVALYQEALQVLGERDTPLRAMLLARLAREFHWSDIAEGQSLSRLAVEIARRLDDPSTLVFVLNHRHGAIWGPDNLQERLAIASEAVDLCERSPARLLAPHSRYFRMVDLLELGEVEAVDQEIEYYSRVSEKSWLPAGFRERAQAARALMEGRFEESERFAREALALGQQVQRRSRMAFGAYLIALYREQGRVERYDSLLRALPMNSPSIVPIGRCTRAYCWAETGRLAEARHEFELLAADGFRSLRRDETWLNGMIWLAETCAILGDSRRASTLHDMLAPFASRNVVSDLNATYGSVEHYLGILAATMSQFAQAETHFQAALRFNGRMHARPFVARTEYEYAGMLLKRGQASDRDRALEMAASALKTAEILGMATVAQKARALLSGSGIAATSPTASGLGQLAKAAPERVLGTVLFTDMVGSTEIASRLGDRQFGALLESYYSLARKQFANFKGREMGTAGDGIVAIFNRPASAISCACAIRDELLKLGIQLKAGLHAGEFELSTDRVMGIAVHIGARIAACAAAGEVLVSSTVKDLVGGAGIHFIDHGAWPLKGVPGKWHLYLAEPSAVTETI